MLLRLTVQIVIIIFVVIKATTSSTASAVLEEEALTNNEAVTATFSQSDVVIEVGEQAQLFFRLTGRFSNFTAGNGYYLYFTYQEEPEAEITSKQRTLVIQDLADVAPPSINDTDTFPIPFVIVGVAPGQVLIGLNSTNPEFENRRDRYVRIRVIRSHWIDVVNFTVGILYVFCWSASFYPQTWLNYTRKSVVGLNFDFVGLNIIGFVVYSTFNVGLYWVPPLQTMYYEKHPRGVIPVQLADCIFALHCLGITIIQGIQCFVYERGGQRLSPICSLLLGGLTSFLLISLILAFTCGSSCGVTWLQFVYFASYVKLGVVLIKYAPQAYMNYKRKSTWGWSIGQVYLDFTGGFLSIGQMILLAYNYSDWESLTGDSTKLGLGLVSILYNILFFMQHYCLYGPSVGGLIAVDVEGLNRSDASVNGIIEYQLVRSTDEKTRLL